MKRLSSPGDCADAYNVLGGSLAYSDFAPTFASPSPSSRRGVNTIVRPGQWLSWHVLWCCWTHTGTAEAVEPTEVLVVNSLGLVRAVGRHIVIKRLFHDYATVFHRCVLDAEQLSDLDVHCAAYPDIAWHMSRQHQIIMSNAALETLTSQSWRLRFSANTIKALKEDVASGNCILVGTMSGDAGLVNRVVAVTAVRLELIDKSIFACMLKYKAGEGFTVLAQLPGVKHRVVQDDTGTRMERCDEALRRIVRGQFKEALDDASVFLEGPLRNDVTDRSSRFGLQTHYIQNHYVAQTPWILDLPKLHARSAEGRKICSPCGRRSRLLLALPKVDDCFLLDDDKGLLVCAWVRSEAYLAMLRKSSSKRAMAEFIEHVRAEGVNSSGEPVFT